MKIREWLLVSLILVFSFCLLVECGQRSEKLKGEKVAQVESEQETAGVKREQEKLQKEKKEVESRGKIRQAEEETEKRVLRIVNRIEKFPFFKLEGIRRLEDIKWKDTPDEEEMQRLLKELVSIGKAGVPTLIKVIKNKKGDWQLRMVLISLVVDEIRDDRIVELLIEIMNDKREDIIVRNEVVDILNEKFDKGFTKVEITYKEQKRIEKKVRKLLTGIERKCKLCRDDLESAGWLVAPEWNAIEKIGRPAIPTLLEVFKDKNRDWRLRFFLGKYIIRDIIIDVVKDKDDRVIEVFVEVLEEKSDNTMVRASAIYGLCMIGDKRAVLPLIKVLKEEVLKIGRFPTLPMLLGALKDERAIEPLIEALDDD
ncbi:MAG: HEAT repeat domain-containing protein, partial [bacterium]